MKKLWCISGLVLKSFFRSVKWMLLLAIGLAGSLGCYYFVYKEPGTKYMALHMAAYGQMVLTLTFLMMGIETKREQDSMGFRAVIPTLRQGPLLWALGQVLAMGAMAILVSAVMMAGCLAGPVIQGAPGLWLRQLTGDILLQYCLPCWLLGMTGLLLSQWIQGKIVYLPAMAVWLLTASIGGDIYSMLETAGVPNSGFWKGFFNMGIESFRYPGNFLTGPALELPRWLARLGLLVMVGLAYVGGSLSRAGLRQERGKGLAVSTAAAVLTVVFAGGMCARYHVFYERFAAPDLAKEYAMDQQMLYRPGEPVSLTDAFPLEKRIKLQKTDIDFTSSTQGIRCRVTLQGEMTEAAAGQSFTLYSDFQVDEVMVDGQSAAFERSHDGLMVNFPAEKAAGDAITVEFAYHGYSLPIYPANETTVQLNGSFPWIPWPGIKTYTRYRNIYNYYLSEDFFIEDWQREDEVAYTLRYRGPGHLYTNLTADGGIYSGLSRDGVSLYSGMVRYEDQARDVTVYAPASVFDVAQDYGATAAEAYPILAEHSEKMGVLRMPEAPKEIVVVQIPYPSDVGFQETYSRGACWEIRQENVYAITSWWLWRSSESPEEFVSNVNADLVAGYLVNPCTGYPVDSPHSGHYLFGMFYQYSLTARMWDDETFDLKVGDLINYDLDTVYDTYMGVPTPEEDRHRLTKTEKQQIRTILERMRAGESFEDTFRSWYQRLLKREVIPISEVIQMLYENKEA